MSPRGNCFLWWTPTISICWRVWLWKTVWAIVSLIPHRHAVVQSRTVKPYTSICWTGPQTRGWSEWSQWWPLPLRIGALAYSNAVHCYLCFPWSLCWLSRVWGMWARILRFFKANRKRQQCSPFLKYGADPNTHMSDKTLALHVAVSLCKFIGKSQIVKELIKCGTNANAIGPRGKMPLHLAVTRNQFKKLCLPLET